MPRFLEDRTYGLALLGAGLLALFLSVPGLIVDGTPPLRVLFGWGAIPVAVALLAGGAALLIVKQRGWQARWWAVVALEALAVCLLTGIHLAAGGGLPLAWAGGGGGLVGAAAGHWLVKLGGRPLAWIVTLIATVSIGVAVWFTLPAEWTAAFAARLVQLMREMVPARSSPSPSTPLPSPEPAPVFDRPQSPTSSRTASPSRGRLKPALVEPSEGEQIPAQATPRGRGKQTPTTTPVGLASRTPAKVAPPPSTAERTPRRKTRSDGLPPVDLLRADPGGRAGGADVRQRAQTLKQTLAEFGVPVEVVSVKEGPTVTQFGLEPGEIVRELRSGETLRRRVSVAMIMRLSNDLALALAAESIRIEAPVPGRPYVGIEIPNAAKTMVSLRGVLESKEFARSHSPLIVALGRDVSGDPVVADLVRMPHLLIAGATGSGKSVCINAIICSLLMNNGPETVRLLMVDPKMVELPGYNGIPHLIAPVVTDPSQATGALAWLTLQMDERYRQFAAVGVRNIEEYNRRQAKARKEILPYIILVIDELADLMMTSAYDVERQICRLAQLSRATGIHLVLATQRPSVDVITGLIKANFPARIAFAVTTQIDSRVILDSPGAERLLGRGDMLFMAPDSAKLARIQGCFVSDGEIEHLVQFWKTDRESGETSGKAPGQAPVVAPWVGLLDQMEEKDDLLEKALQLLNGKKTISTSLLQRQLRLGYPRAARLMEQLEEMGAVGPDEGGGRSRAVLVRPDDGSSTGL